MIEGIEVGPPMFYEVGKFEDVSLISKHTYAAQLLKQYADENGLRYRCVVDYNNIYYFKDKPEPGLIRARDIRASGCSFREVLDDTCD